MHVQSPVHVENGTDGRLGERDQMRGRKTMKTNVRSHRLRRIDESGRTATIVSHELSDTSYHHIIIISSLHNHIIIKSSSRYHHHLIIRSSPTFFPGGPKERSWAARGVRSAPEQKHKKLFFVFFDSPNQKTGTKKTFLRKSGNLENLGSSALGSQMTIFLAMQLWIPLVL